MTKIRVSSPGEWPNGMSAGVTGWQGWKLDPKINVKEGVLRDLLYIKRCQGEAKSDWSYYNGRTLQWWEFTTTTKEIEQVPTIINDFRKEKSREFLAEWAEFDRLRELALPLKVGARVMIPPKDHYSKTIYGTLLSVQYIEAVDKTFADIKIDGCEFAQGAEIQNIAVME